MKPVSQRRETNAIASSLAAEPRYYTDDEISREFDGAYDQPHYHDGYEDDGDYAQPYRYLKNWSLWSSADKAQKKQNPLALPDGYFSPGTVLKGFVVPRDSTKHDPLPIKIPLSSADYVTVDRSIRYRGFWIIVSSPATLPDDATMPACYWLQEPDEAIAPGAAKSQAEIHFDHRAWLAVLSNLIDALFPDFDKGANYAEQGVHEVHEKLKRGDEEPFDKAMLMRYKDKIKPHLIGAQGYLTKTCAFVKSINSIRPAKARKNPRQLEELIRSTEAAEMRSKQYPWGEPKLPVANANAARQKTADSYEPERSRQQQRRVKTCAGATHEKSVLETMDSSEQGKKPAAVTASTAYALTWPSENDALSQKRGTKTASAAGNAVNEEQQTLTEPENRNGAGFENLAASKVKKSHQGLQNTDVYAVSESNAKNSKKRTLCDDEAGSRQHAGDDQYSVKSSSKRKRKRLKHLAPACRVPLFAGDEMGKALNFCRKFFNPKTSEVDVDCSCWNIVEERSFCLRDGKKAESLLRAAKDWGNDKGPEWYLLIVAAYRQSCLQFHDVVHKKIVQKVVGKKPMSKMLFQKWRNHAMELLKNRQAKESTPLKMVEKSTEFLLLLNIVRLIVDCKLVNSKYTLVTLRNRGIDWQAIVDEVSAFNMEIVGHSKTLQEACTAAQNRLDEINEQSGANSGRDASVLSAAGTTRRTCGHEGGLEGAGTG